MPPMLRWLGERLGNSQSPSHSSSPSTASSAYSSPRKEGDLSAAYASDPSQWESSFEKLWTKAEKCLERMENNNEHEISYEEVTIFVSLLKEMCQLLMMEVNAQPEPAIGPILDRFFTQQILERTMDWAIQVPLTYRPICQLALIRVYDMIVSESHTQNHCLLVHKPVLIPLFRLFEWCRNDTGARQRGRGADPSATDKHFVLLLYQICTKMAGDPTLLHFFFTCAEGADQFVVFNLLVKFLYDQNDVGQLARDALLLILSVSSKNKSVAEFVAIKSSFCPVLATGLSGCFSQLSRFLGAEMERTLDSAAHEALTDFHSSLLFCNAVVQAAHGAIVEKIAQFFYSGFLMSVVRPALLQEEREGAAAATVYLQICLSTVTEEPLLRTIVRMLLLEKDDDDILPIIQIIISRIKIADRLGTVSLSLLDDLIQLGCEDVMLVLAFRTLLPLRHATRSLLSKVRDQSQSVQLSEKLLGCVPQCALKYDDVASRLTVSLYMKEGATLIQKRVASCARWRWRYDGVQPSPLLFRGDSDDERSLHSGFHRLSSVRSSMSSSARGINRYFSSKSAHLTAESGVGEAGHKLASLGGSADQSPRDSRSSSPVVEDSEFILPPITSSKMTSSMVDYFQLVAYDDLSDDPPSSPERSKVQTKPMNGHSNGGELMSEREEKSEAESSARGFDTDAEMARSFVLSGFGDVEDLDTFKSLLDRRLLNPKKMAGLAENMAFIDSKIQYMRELAEEKVEEPADISGASEPQNETGHEEPLRGQPIEQVPGNEDKFFVDDLFDQLDSMCGHGLAYNIQLARVLVSLATYPHPLLVSYMFNYSNDPDSHGTRLFEILESLRDRVDAYAETVEGVDVFIGRAVRQLNAKVGRAGRQPDFATRFIESPREDPNLARGRNYGGSGRRNYYRYHSHKVVESREAARIDETTKCVVHSAIVLAHLVQQLAGIVLHYPIAVLNQYNPPNNS
ncbi:unnamed protein product, partial [Mesorhabditis spiculigera]